MDKLEFGYDPLLHTHFNEAPERYHTTDGYPEIPVSPIDLSDAVSKQLQSFNDMKVPDKTPTMVEEMCKGFNECIRLNSLHEIPQTLVFSPKTGSAKSVTAKMYIAMLESESALVIVPTVADANQFCKDINEWSVNRSRGAYSLKVGCYYSITKENPESAYYCEKLLIKLPQCLVITHAMFKIINKHDDSSLADAIKSRADKLIIVDERLNHYNSYSIPNDRLEDLITVLEKLQKRTKHDYGEYIKSLNAVNDLFTAIPNSVIASNVPKDPHSRKDLVLIDYQQHCDLGIEALSEKIDIFEIRESINSIKNILSLSNTLIKSSDQANSDLKASAMDLLRNIKEVLAKELLYIQKGNRRELVAVENILNGYGSYVVLDATATVNEIYEDKAYYNSMGIKHISTTDPRIYDNLTIYRALNYPQSRGKIYRDKSPQEVNESIKIYLKVAESLLQEEDDILLIVTFKKFRTKLEEKCSNKKIEFTHWGNHVGKNEWSHCNKVMIIGWNYLTDDVAALNYINAVGSVEVAHQRLSSSTLDDYKRTQLIDDLVQASMRGSARKTFDTNGNCEKCDVYLFIPKGEDAQKVYEGFTSEFKGAKEEVWNLQVSQPLIKKSKPEERADSIIKYLDSIKDTTQDILQKTVREALDISTSTFSDTIKSQYFKDKLKQKGYAQKGKNGRSNLFIL